MPFGVIGQVGPGMRQVVGFGDQSMGRRTFGGILERAIVTSGDFTAYLCDKITTWPSSQITLGKLANVLLCYLIITPLAIHRSESWSCVLYALHT